MTPPSITVLSSVVLSILLCTTFFQTTHAFKRLHIVPTLTANSSPVPMIHGAVLTKHVNGVHSQVPHMIRFAAQLKRDVIVWDELQQDALRITACSRHPATRTATVRIQGSALDPSDFRVGAAFVISVEDWEQNCANVEPVLGIDEADDALFYVIEDVSVAGSEVSCQMSIVPGRDVVPTVEVDVHNTPAVKAGVPQRSVFFDDDTGALQALARQDYGQNIRQNDSLPVVERPSVSFSRDVRLFDGGFLKVDASISADINRFKIKRFFKTEVQWEQSLRASANAELNIDKQFEGSTGGEVFKKPIPKFGFSAKIPFVGRVRAGAFVEVAWVAELEVDTKVKIRFNAVHHLRQIVDARIAPPRYSSRNLPVPSSSGTSSFSFGENNEVDVGVIGFIGLRPAVSVEVSLGSKGVGGNVGAKVGVEAATQAKSPPFAPLTSHSGLKLGNCNACHYLRGSMSVKGKDLAAQLVKNNKVEKEFVLVAELFEIRLGTLCAISATCPATTTTPPARTPTPSPSPRPVPGVFCKPCVPGAGSFLSCGTGSFCLSSTRRCTKIVGIGAKCNPSCTVCVGGTCKNGRCEKKASGPAPRPIPTRRPVPTIRPLPKPLPTRGPGRPPVHRL